MRSNRLLAGGLLALSLIYLTSFAAPMAYAADQKETPKPVTAKKAVGFVGSSESKVYHVATCGYAKKIKPENKVKFASKAEAVKAGYTPCKICIKS